MTRFDKAMGGLLIVQLIVLGTLIFAPAQTRTQPASASPAFDHSHCQYPTRTTNPPDGCDNSDPCDPLSAVKGGSGECAPVQAPAEAQPTETAPVQPVQCGGK